MCPTETRPQTIENPREGRTRPVCRSVFSIRPPLTEKKRPRTVGVPIRHNASHTGPSPRPAVGVSLGVVSGGRNLQLHEPPRYFARLHGLVRLRLNFASVSERCFAAPVQKNDCRGRPFLLGGLCTVVRRGEATA